MDAFAGRTCVDVPGDINGMRLIRYGALVPPYESPWDAVLQEDWTAQQARFVAICRASSPNRYCTVFCTADWRAIASEFNETLSRAASVAETRYGDSLQWCFWENGLVSLLRFAQKWTVYSATSLVLLTMTAFLEPFGILVPAGMLVAATILVIAALIIWFIVARLAVASGGWLYGILHLLLTVLFTPSLLGLFVFPSLVLGDLDRWREWDETQPLSPGR